MKRRHLIFQDDWNNHNKFYTMTQKSDSEFEVEYGRIGASSQFHTYLISKWESIYESKLRKGYTDVTDFTASKGSVVVTRDNQLGIVVDVHYTGNVPVEALVFTETNGYIRVIGERLRKGCLNPEYITHLAFYPKLIEKYKRMNE